MASSADIRGLFPDVDEGEYLEFHAETASKGNHKWYWAIRAGSTLVRLYGRLPGFGVEANYLTMNKNFQGAARAHQEFWKIVDGKRSKGYAAARKIPQSVFDFAVQQLRAVTGQVEAEGRAARRVDKAEKMEAFKPRRVEV